MPEITKEWIERLKHYTSMVEGNIDDYEDMDVATRSSICGLLGYLSSIEILEEDNK